MLWHEEVNELVTTTSVTTSPSGLGTDSQLGEAGLNEVVRTVPFSDALAEPEARSVTSSPASSGSTPQPLLIAAASYPLPADVSDP